MGWRLLTAMAILAAAYGAARLRGDVSCGNEDLAEPVVPQSVGRFDPDLGWSLQPGARAVSCRLGYPVEYSINSDGLRGREIASTKKGKARILLLGDSRTFGYGVSIEGHFSRELERLLPKVEVINLGVSGFGVDQQLLALRKLGRKYEPDLVVSYVAHYADDRHLHSNRFGRNKPRFLFAASGLKLIGVPVPLVSLPDTWAPDAWLNPLGEALIRETAKEASDLGARYLLVTHLDTLEKAVQGEIPTLNVLRLAKWSEFSLPRGFQHLNEAGNAVLARLIARFIEERRVLPNPPTLSAR